MTFKTSQGLGSHLNCCHYYKVEQDQELQKGNINIILPPATKDAAGKTSNPTFRRMYATVESNMIAVHEDGCDDKNADNNVNTTNQKLRKDGEVDGRKDNRGMSIRTVYTNQEKLTHIERYESWLNEELGKGNVHATVSSYIHKLRLPTKFKIYLSTKGAGWREPERKRSIIDAVTSKLKKNLSVPNRSRLYLPKYPVMERELVKQLKEKRSRKARVSALWIRTTAKNLSTDTNFKASNGWLFRFLRRNKIRYRKRKNQKSVSAEEKRSKLQLWHQKLCYEVLPYRNGHIGSYDGMFGRFPPDRRYNMDQVPMPFVVEQNDTYTEETDCHVHVRGVGSEGLSKRQYTVHVFINAGGTGNGYIDLICRGQGKRVSQVEKEAYNTKVNVRWQKKAWVDREVMIDIAKSFVLFKREKHGDDAVLLFADNLDAHCYQPVLDIFAEANILVWFIVPGCTDLIQPIDAGIGRSIRIYVGHALDRWLSVDGNLDLWEGKLSASERRIMMTNFLASAMDKMLSEEKKEVRIGAFKRTGCLIELSNRELAEPDGDMQFSDDYIKPQGLIGKYVVPIQAGITMGIGTHDVAVPDDQLTAEAIDGISNDEEENNDLLGGEGDNEELDESQDVIQSNEDEECLVPGGIDKV